MNEVRDIYLLLQQNNGMKIRDIARKLHLDIYHVAEIMFSLDNAVYWQHDSASIWYAKENSAFIDVIDEDDAFIKGVSILRTNNIDRYVPQNCSVSTRIYLQSLKRNYRLTDSDKRELIRLYRKGKKRAYDVLVKGSQNLVLSVVFLYRNKGVSYDDLIQEGNLGLIKAIKNFNIESPMSFDNYAKKWILQAVSNNVMLSFCVVHIPLNKIVEHRVLNSTIDKFLAKNGYETPCDDIIHYRNKYIEISKEVLFFPRNLSELVIDSFNLEELLIADKKCIPDHNIIQESLAIFLERLAYRSCLSSRNLKIYKMSCDFIHGEEVSLEKIAMEFGLTRERARQIVADISDKIKEYIKENELYDLFQESLPSFIMPSVKPPLCADSTSHPNAAQEKAKTEGSAINEIECSQTIDSDVSNHVIKFTTSPYRRTYTPAIVNSLNPNEIYVFATNIRGLHNAGTAAIAYKKFGAEWGVEEGLTGQCYALPILEQSINDVAGKVRTFMAFAIAHPELRFYVTDVTCSITNSAIDEICLLFKDAFAITNIILPPNIVEVIRKSF